MRQKRQARNVTPAGKYLRRDFRAIDAVVDDKRAPKQRDGYLRRDMRAKS